MNPSEPTLETVPGPMPADLRALLTRRATFATTDHAAHQYRLARRRHAAAGNPATADILDRARAAELTDPEEADR